MNEKENEQNLETISVNEIETIQPMTDTMIRQELNIAKWPIFTTSQFKGNTRKYTRKIKLDDDTYEEKSITVKPFNNESLLRIFDYKVFCVLIRLWELSGRKVYENVSFSFNRIIKEMNLKPGKTTTEYIKKSLIRLNDVNILWERNFYKRKKNLEEAFISFHLLDYISNFERKDELYFGDSFFRINKEVLENILDNYSKPMFLNEILALDKDISVLLYNYLDLMLAKQNLFKKSTKKLFDDLDLTTYKGKFERKRALEPCIKELLNKKLSTGTITNCKLVDSPFENDYVFVIEKENFKQTKEIQIETNRDVIVCLDYLEKKFPNQNFDMQCLNILTRKYDIEKIVNHIMKMPENVENPIGFLKSSLENNWIFPKTQEEIIKEKLEKQETMRKKKIQEELQKKELFFMEEAKDENIWQEFNNLPVEQKELIEKQAISKIETEINKKKGQDIHSDKLFFNELALKIKIIELLKNS